jgi:hypothetical protein
LHSHDSIVPAVGVSVNERHLECAQGDNMGRICASEAEVKRRELPHAEFDEWLRKYRGARTYESTSRLPGSAQTEQELRQPHRRRGDALLHGFFLCEWSQ